MQNKIRNPTDPVCDTKKHHPYKGQKIRKHAIVERSQQRSQRLLRHYDQDERDSDGAVDWQTVNARLMR